jgi:hypothetical protein
MGDWNTKTRSFQFLERGLEMPKSWRNSHAQSHFWIPLIIVTIGVLEACVVMLIRWLAQ